jgi:hypothetical protein
LTARLRLRPDFRLPLPDDGGPLMRRLRERLSRDVCPFIGQVRDHHAYLRLPRDQRSPFSPTLELELLETGPGVVLYGRFTPHPHVWTGYMAVFGVLILVALGGLVYGLAQTLLDERPWALAAVPVAALLGGFVYGASFIGQGLSAGEMCALRAFVDAALRESRRTDV